MQQGAHEVDFTISDPCRPEVRNNSNKSDIAAACAFARSSVLKTK